MILRGIPRKGEELRFKVLFLFLLVLLGISIFIGDGFPASAATTPSGTSSSLSTSQQNTIGSQLHCSSLESSVPENLKEVIPGIYCCFQSDRETCLQQHADLVEEFGRLLNSYLSYCESILNIPIENSCGSRNRFNPGGASSNESALTCQIEQYNSIHSQLVSCLKKN